MEVDRHPLGNDGGGSSRGSALTVIFPSWVNKLPAIAAGASLFLGLFVTFVVWYYFSPRNLEVGYSPIQPIPYSHKLHAGLLGMDCRYCHTSVEIGPHANVPPTQTCIGCHGENKIRSDSAYIQKIQAAHRDGMPIEWVKVHMLPQYAYFNHAAHLPGMLIQEHVTCSVTRI